MRVDAARSVLAMRVCEARIATAIRVLRACAPCARVRGAQAYGDTVRAANIRAATTCGDAIRVGRRRGVT
eukprot:799232-Rhodomonas_salina.1